MSLPQGRCSQSRGVTDAILGFHTRQVVEKATKAVLEHGGVEYPYSHDLDGLFELCQENNIEVPDTLFGAGRLSVFGVRLRYRTSPETHLDRDQALRWAAAAIAWAQDIVGQPNLDRATRQSERQRRHPSRSKAPLARGRVAVPLLLPSPRLLLAVVLLVPESSRRLAARPEMNLLSRCSISPGTVCDNHRRGEHVAVDRTLHVR